MTDRPRFDADETTSTYSPPPDDRRGWGAEHGWVPPQPLTPRHWIEPTWAPGLQAPVPQPSRRGNERGGTLLALVFISLLSAGLASGGTYYLLASSGRLNARWPVPASQLTGQAVAPSPVVQNVTINEQSAVTQARRPRSAPRW